MMSSRLQVTLAFLRCINADAFISDKMLEFIEANMLVNITALQLSGILYRRCHDELTTVAVSHSACTWAVYGSSALSMQDITSEVYHKRNVKTIYSLWICIGELYGRELPAPVAPPVATVSCAQHCPQQSHSGTKRSVKQAVLNNLCAA
jgi:hypothetical protein